MCQFVKKKIVKTWTFPTKATPKKFFKKKCANTSRKGQSLKLSTVPTKPTQGISHNSHFPNPITSKNHKPQRPILKRKDFSYLRLQIRNREWEKRTWKRMVSRASGAVQVLLKAPASPPARSCCTVPVCVCFVGLCCCGCCCCRNFRSTTLPWVEFKALCPPSTTTPTRASIFIASLCLSLSNNRCAQVGDLDSQGLNNSWRISETPLIEKYGNHGVVEILWKIERKRNPSKKP